MASDISQNLLDRTLNLSKNTIDLVLGLLKHQVNQVIAKQLIRSITSIGANYREACEAESGKDFVHKIRIAKKECRESLYWFELLEKASPGDKETIASLSKETTELLKIFSSISAKFKTPKV